MTPNKKIGISFALAAVILGQMALPTIAQEGNVLTRTVDNLPVNSGTKAANELTGEAFFPDDAKKEEGGDSTGEAFPQDDVSGEEPLGEAGDDIAMEVPDEALPEREYDPEGDPITQAATKLLDESGVIGRQRVISESILMMDQQLKHNSKIQEVLNALGPDAQIEISPGVYKTYEGTPAAMRARISYIRLQQELAEALNQGPTLDASMMEPAAISLPVRNDGTEFQQFDTEIGIADDDDEPDVKSQINDLLQQAEERLARREAEILASVESSAPKPPVEEPVPAGPSIEDVSVREIYGSNGVFASVIDVQGTRREIRIGDEIVDGFTVKKIGSDFVEVIKDGQSTRLSL